MPTANGGPVWTIISVAIASILTFLGVLSANRNAQKVAAQQLKSQENVAQLQSLQPIYQVWKETAAELRQQVSDCKHSKVKLERRCRNAIMRVEGLESHILRLRQQAVMNGVSRHELPPLPEGFGDPIDSELAGD